MMEICTGEGTFKICARGELSVRIRKRAESPKDEIWISGDEKYPCLGILVNGVHACVHFFEDDSGTMWQSQSMHGKAVTFLAGGVEWEAPADAVVSLEAAIHCAEEFFETGKRPDCMDWLEL